MDRSSSKNSKILSESSANGEVERSNAVQTENIPINIKITSLYGSGPGFETLDRESGKVNLKLAAQIQNELRAQVKLQAFRKPIRAIGGADISFNRFSTKAYAVFVVLDFKTNERIDSSYMIGELGFPYIPGFLSFREIPLLLQAWDKLKVKPDLLMMDGQGIAHPRRLGVASHFGVLTDSPTVGCAKSRLYGDYQEPPLDAGSFSRLTDKDDLLGFVFRTKKNTLPIFASPGHRVDCISMLRILNSMIFKYRIPEPTRQAHLYCNEIRVADNRGVHIAE